MREVLYAFAVNTYVNFRLWLWSRQKRFTWKCCKVGGGGMLRTPRRMTQEKACRWLVRQTGSEIIFVDSEHHFIFYQTRAL
jgi:hypothetical protein